MRAELPLLRCLTLLLATGCGTPPGGSDGGSDGGSCTTSWPDSGVDGGCSSFAGHLTAVGAAETVEVAGGGVTLIRNVTYGHLGGLDLQGDLYLPVHRDAGVAPGILVVVHGGGWADCARRRGTTDVSNYALGMAAFLGIATFNIEYRLIQEGGAHPEAVKDVRCALQWVAAHAPERAQAYGIPLDGTRLGIAGESAGAHLTLMAALTEDRGDLDPGCGPPHAPLRLAMAYSSPADFPSIQSTEYAYGAVQGYAGPCDVAVDGCSHGRACDRCVDSSPAAHACEATGRVLVIQAPDPYDFLIPQRHGERMAEAFADAGYANGQLVMPSADQITDGGCGVGEAHGFNKLCLVTAASNVTTPLVQAELGP